MKTLLRKRGNWITPHIYTTFLLKDLSVTSEQKHKTKAKCLIFFFSPHICIQQNLKKTPPKSLLNNLVWNVYPLTKQNKKKKRHKITRKYKVLKPFPEATAAYTVHLFWFLYARKDLLKLSVQHRAQGTTKDTQIPFLMGISIEEKEDRFTVQEATLAYCESNLPEHAKRWSP